MINAGTVGAYLELDIGGFTANLSTAGQLLEQFRKENDDGFRGAGGLGDALLEGLSAPILAAGRAVAEWAGIFSGSSANVRSDAELTGGVIGGLGETIHSAAEEASGLYSEKIQSAADSVAEAVRGVSATLAENGDAWHALARDQDGCGERIADSARHSADAVCGTFGMLPEETRSYMRNAWGGMKDELERGKPALTVSAKSDGNGILYGINSALGDSASSGGMRGAGRNAVGSLRKGMNDERPAATASVKGLMENMATAARSVSFTGIGGNVVSGILKGINDKAPSLMNRARSLAAGIAETVRSALNVNSPSKVMIPMGRAVAEGMEVGLMQGAGSLYDTASAISMETAEALGNISSPGLPVSGRHSAGEGDKLQRLLDAVERLADSQTTMEIDGRSFGRLVRSAQRS